MAWVGRERKRDKDKERSFVKGGHGYQIRYVKRMLCLPAGGKRQAISSRF
jgi:hypothetical protein